MTTKFTPGPWYVGAGTYEGRNIYSAASVTDDEGFTYQPLVASAEDDGISSCKIGSMSLWQKVN